MSRAIGVLAAVTCAATLAFPSSSTAETRSQEPQGAGTVAQWLVLGPAIDALPVFHDENPGGFDLNALRDASRFPSASVWPAVGDELQWFGGANLAWAEWMADSDGMIELNAPGELGNNQVAVTWLAAYLEVDRFASVDVTLLGSHARTLTVDGQDVVSANGGEGEKSADVKLIRGKHLILVRAVRDPSIDAPWKVGVKIESSEASANVAYSLDPMRDMTIHDITDAPTIGSVSVSPDGQLVAAAVGRYLPGTDDRESWVEVRETETGDLVRTWRGSQMGRVAWAPVGRTVSYVTSQNGKSTLWLGDLETNTVVPLLERVEDFAGYRWAPDANSIVFMTSPNPEDENRGIKRLEGLMDRWATYRTKTHLNLVTVPGGTVRRLTSGSLTTDVGGYSPDGARILFMRTIEDFRRRPFSRTELWELNLSSLESELLREFRWISGASYSPEGNRILVQGGAVEFDGVGLNIPEGMIANTYDNQLFIWDREAEEVEPITRDFDPAVGNAVWSRADGDIYIVASDRDYSRLFRYDVDGGTFDQLETGFDVFGSLDVAANAAVAVGTGTSPWSPQGLVAIDLERGRHEVLHRPGANWFENVRTGTVESWTFTASSGKTIDGRVYYPPGFDRSRTYPAIVNYYGGTSPVSRNFGGRYPKEYWAAHGYVVYVPQPSGATGYGQEFSAVHVNDWGKTTVDEVVEGTRRFLEEHPFVDAERVGNIGASYGGFMTMLLSTKTDVFSASVAHAGISALSSYWGEGYWGYLYSAVATAESYPWNRPDIYVDQSPLFRADQNTTPILLTHGASDTNVPVGESDQFYIALKLLGKEVEYLQVAGEDHWILDHAKRIVWSRSILAWYDRLLKGEPEWWADLYPDRR